MAQQFTARQPLTQEDPAQRLTVTVEQAARLLGIGRNVAYEAVKTGQLPSARIGRRIVIPRVALDRWLESAVPAPDLTAPSHGGSMLP